MSQWQKLQSLDPELQLKVCRVYSTTFPREYRNILSEWIENQDWNSAASDESKARSCFSELMVYLENMHLASIHQNNILQSPDYHRIKTDMQKFHGPNPLSLAVTISQCLQEERNILASTVQKQSYSHDDWDENSNKLDDEIKYLRMLSSNVVDGIQSLQNLDMELHVQEDISKAQGELQSWGAPSQLAKDKACEDLLNAISHKRQEVLEQIKSAVKLAEQITEALVGVNLPAWKRKQQLACIGCPVDACLNRLQTWFTTVFEVLYQISKHLQSLKDQPVSSADIANIYIVNTESLTNRLLVRILSSALVVEKQPVSSKNLHRPLTLKTEVAFSAKVRFLVNSQMLNLQLKVQPVFDSERIDGFRHFKLANSCPKKLCKDQQNNSLVAEFINMELKAASLKVASKRALTTDTEPVVNGGGCQPEPLAKRIVGKKGTDKSNLTVMEELHLLKFVMNLRLDGLELSIQANSLPVVVVTSANQYSDAWATIMWYNMLPPADPTKEQLQLFLRPPKLSWMDVGQVLSWQFQTMGERGLNQDQLEGLRDRFMDDPQGFVTWENFSKNKQTWTWIYGILDLIKKCLGDLWKQNRIMGFVSKEKTQALLQEKCTGTFLLRFSESKSEGAITFSWVENDGTKKLVHAIQPFSKVELLRSPLPSSLYDYKMNDRKPLHYLYPDIPIEQAFGPFPTPIVEMPPMQNGYLSKKMVVVSSLATDAQLPVSPELMNVDIPNPPESQSVLMTTADPIFNVGDFAQFEHSLTCPPDFNSDLSPLLEEHDLQSGFF